MSHALTSVPVVCAVGATEPWNAAGLGLDLRALAECGTRAVMVVAGVTAQDEGGLRGFLPVPAALIGEQFAALAGLAIAAYRVGALLDVPGLEVVADRLGATAVPVVYDPVFAPTFGGTFAGPDLIRAIGRRLLARVDVLTPNLAETGALLEADAPGSVAQMVEAARALVARGPRAVLIKGGHLSGQRVVDVFFNGELRVYEEARIGADLRGTGCLLADALAAALARGSAPLDAVAAARSFVREKIERGVRLGPMRTAY